MLTFELAVQKLQPLVELIQKPLFSNPGDHSLPTCFVEWNPSLIEDRLYVDNTFIETVSKSKLIGPHGVVMPELSESNWPFNRDKELVKIHNSLHLENTKDMVLTLEKKEVRKLWKRIDAYIESMMSWDALLVNKIVGDIHIIESYCQDVKLIQGSLLLSGGTHPLGELLFNVYKAGAFPCGWLGEYPEGNLIVFWPYEDEPEFRL